MTTEEINRYIAVASKWEQKYAETMLRLDSSERMVNIYDEHVNTLESQLKIQDNAIERKDAYIVRQDRIIVGLGITVSILAGALIWCLL